jgi:excisionase family DNA binding protein
MNYLSAETVAERLSISCKTVRRYLKSGKLPSIKLGKLRRISEADLEEFIEKRRVRDEAETAYYKRKDELLTEAAGVVANWESKRKKLWIETRNVPVLSMGRK